MDHHRSKRQYPGYWEAPPPLPWANHPMGFFAPGLPPPPPKQPPYGPRYDQHPYPRSSRGPGGRRNNRGWGNSEGPGPRRPRKKAKGGGSFSAESPLSVPPAPYNSNTYLATHGPMPTPRATPCILGAEYHTLTPNPHGGTPWRNTCDLDPDFLDRAKELGLDIFGNNQDVMLSVGLAPREYDDDEEDFDSDVSMSEHEQEANVSDTAKLEQQLAAQTAYIAELEERNMNLSEKVYILERELKALRASAGRGDVSPQQQQGQAEEDHEDHQDQQQPLQVPLSPAAVELAAASSPSAADASPSTATTFTRSSPPQGTAAATALLASQPSPGRVGIS